MLVFSLIDSASIASSSSLPDNHSITSEMLLSDSLVSICSSSYHSGISSISHSGLTYTGACRSHFDFACSWV